MHTAFPPWSRSGPRRGPFAGGWRVGLVLLCLAVGARPVLATPDGAVSKEYQLKAAFLYNFTKFVEWPPLRFDEASQPIVIGVLGHNPFGGELEKIVAGRTVNGRAIHVRALVNATAAREVDVVFLSAAEDPRCASVLAELDGAGVVTVGESSSSSAHGGMITFTMEADKVRFEINQDAAERAGLKISAQLLKLATIVHQRPRKS